MIGKAAGQWALCARSPSTSCVVVEEDRNEVEIYALDARARQRTQNHGAPR